MERHSSDLPHRLAGPLVGVDDHGQLVAGLQAVFQVVVGQRIEVHQAVLARRRRPGLAGGRGVRGACRQGGAKYQQASRRGSQRDRTCGKRGHLPKHGVSFALLWAKS
jgi:hypothetical protein